MIEKMHQGGKRDYVAEEDQQARTLLSGVLFLLAFLALLFFVIPAFVAMRGSQERLVALVLEAERERQTEENYEEAHVALMRHSAALRRAKTALPTLEAGAGSDVPELLATLEVLVERDVGGIFLDELHVGTDAELASGGEGLHWRPIRLSGLAGTSSIIRLLDQVRGALHLIEPVMLTMEPAGEDVVQFELHLRRAVQKAN